jgi:UDP-N-acetylglucosamine 2-epimerase (non-hydrolysing)
VSDVLHVVGARPNFVKAAPVIAAGRTLGYKQRLVHTGQHYDEAMSDVFFRQLDLPEPDLNLGIGSGRHGAQTGAVLTAIEELLLEDRPNLLVVYGDVNSTVAAALAAAKLGVAVAHVEAGLRSFDVSMPEEINRRITDSLSTLLFATSPEAIGHLGGEGIPPDRVHLVGNPMIDTLLAQLDRLDPTPFRAANGLDGDEPYVVVTMHRPANVDRPETAATIVEALDRIGAQAPIYFPLHPRGRASLEGVGLLRARGVTVLEPLAYVEFLSAVRGARLVITDSGGLQEETTILGVPCLTARTTTERPITISHGTNRLVALDEVAERATEVLDGHITQPAERPPLWDGRSGPRIAGVIAGFLDRV